MRAHMYFGGNTGDTGDRPVNTRAALFPPAVLTVGTLWNQTSSTANKATCSHSSN